MGDLSERDVEDVLEGVQPPGRDDLARVVELTTWLHASREIEPPPAMRDDLFCQIEDGPAAYRRSSRRSPAHLGRHHRVGMRRLARETLAGSGRPIASVAAAAVLLVGVTLAVRAGGPGREPSAYVSPSADGVPTAGGDDPSTSTTLASTTTSPPEAGPAPGAAPTTATTLPRQEPPATVPPTTGSTAPLDTPSASDPEPPAAGDPTLTTTEEHGRDAEDDGDRAASEQASSAQASDDRRVAETPPFASSEETKAWNLWLSGWLFDLSHWPPAEDLWAALGEIEDTDDSVDPGDDASGGDDDLEGVRNGDGGSERQDGGGTDRQDDGENERQDDGENESQDDPGPDEEGGKAG